MEVKSERDRYECVWERESKLIGQLKISFYINFIKNLNKCHCIFSLHEISHNDEFQHRFIRLNTSTGKTMLMRIKSVRKSDTLNNSLSLQSTITLTISYLLQRLFSY